MKLRIHGDNIIECERALKLISEAYKGNIVVNNKNMFMPSYSIVNNNENIFIIKQHQIFR